jgi:hypothetical protein
MPVNGADILRFLAVIAYMGVVLLPSVVNYFVDDHPILPSHPTIQLSKVRFFYIWRNIHLSYTSGGDSDDDEEDLQSNDQVGPVNGLARDHFDGSNNINPYESET